MSTVIAAKKFNPLSQFFPAVRVGGFSPCAHCHDHYAHRCEQWKLCHETSLPDVSLPCNLFFAFLPNTSVSCLKTSQHTNALPNISSLSFAGQIGPSPKSKSLCNFCRILHCSHLRPPQGLWGTRELAIFINGNTGTSGNFQGTTFKKGLLLRNWGTFQHFFLGNIQQILLGTREIF